MLEKISTHLGIDHTDPEVREMRRATDIARLMDEIDDAERRLDPEGAKGPDSAVDTEA